MQDQSSERSSFRLFEHENWERAVQPYHHYFGNLTNQAIKPLLEAVRVRKNMRLLDVATGPGYGAATAAQAQAQATGVDFSAAMVAEARRLYPTVEFREGDAEALPFPQRSFDAVVCNFGLLHFSRPEQALSEAFRVLDSGGWIGFTVWAKPEVAVGFGMILNAIQTHGNLDISLPPGPPFFHFSDPQECSEALQKAGFASPSVAHVPLLWNLPSPDALFEAFFEGTVRSGALLREQSSEILPIIRTALREAAKEYEKDGLIAIPMSAILASAIKP